MLLAQIFALTIADSAPFDNDRSQPGDCGQATEQACRSDIKGDMHARQFSFSPIGPYHCRIQFVRSCPPVTTPPASWHRIFREISLPARYHRSSDRLRCRDAGVCLGRKRFESKPQRQQSVVWLSSGGDSERLADRDPDQHRLGFPDHHQH